MKAKNPKDTIPKVLYIHLADNGPLGSKTATNLSKKYPTVMSQPQQPVSPELSLQESAAAAVSDSPAKSQKFEHQLGGVLLIELAELTYNLLTERKKTPTDPEKIAKLERDLAPIKVKIKEFAPDKIMFAAHGSLQNTDNCFYHPFGENSVPLANAKELADLINEITSSCTSAGVDNISMLVCFGGRSENYDADQSQLDPKEFQTSFAGKFLKEYSSIRTNEQKKRIHLEAFTGETGVNLLTGEFNVKNETQIKLDKKLFEYNDTYLSLKQQIRSLQIKLLDKGNTGSSVQAMLKNPRCQLGLLNKLKQEYEKIHSELVLSGFTKNGIIDFTCDSQGITCGRRYIDAPCDMERIKQLEQKLIFLKGEISISSIKNYFPSASSIEPGKHRWPVDLTHKKFAQYKSKYGDLKGDALITSVLQNFKESLVEIASREALTEKIDEFKASAEYEILEQRQNIFVGWSKPESLAAFESICKEAETALATNPNPSAT